MTAGPIKTETSRSLRRILVATVLAGATVATGVWLLDREDVADPSLTVGEKAAALIADRAGLQARADGSARVGLLVPFRTAGLLTDALLARSVSDQDCPFDRLPLFRQRAFAELDDLNAALAEALARLGDGTRQAANKATEQANAELDRLAGLDDAPLVLSFTPRFVPPRRAAGELALPAGRSSTPPKDKALRVGQAERAPNASAPRPKTPTVPRYAPDFASSRDEDPAVQVEIVGTRLAADGAVPTLAVGAWRGKATVAPGRLHFAVPRSAFATDVSRTLFVTATLSVRSSARPATFQLLFAVLPDRPGAFALDQRIQTTALEEKTLVSPEIVARSPTGETRTVRRCFDPPPGWRFDPVRRRVVVVDRLGWQDDMSDPTLNGGLVEFEPEEKPGEICVAVSARPVNQFARAATIGRIEATLLRDQPAEQAVKTGIRALDWREAARVPIAPGMAEWKLYVRLFDEIDREFDAAPASMPFLRITREDEAGRPTFVLRADPVAEP
jgi:hypothetical protein